MLSQHQLAFLNRDSLEAPPQNVWKSFNLPGKVHKDAFDTAVQYLVTRFDLLRTTFQKQADSFMRAVLHESELKLDVSYVSCESSRYW